MIHLIVALPCEARALRHRLRLRSVAHRPFRLYESGTVRLVISGVGQARAAAATAWLAGRSAEDTCAWLNLGTAGHALRPLGEGLLAHKVVDAVSGQAWYPGLAFDPPVSTETVVSVTRPERDYRHGAAYDMEAAGFCTAAAHFASWELIHCYKVVSDNRHHPVHAVDEAQVEDLMSGHLATIMRLIDTLQAIAAALDAWTSPPLLDWMTGRWQFSQTRRARLARLLQRHHALGLDTAALQARLRYCTTARAALDAVETEVNRTARAGLPS